MGIHQKKNPIIFVDKIISEKATKHRREKTCQ